MLRILAAPLVCFALWAVAAAHAENPLSPAAPPEETVPVAATPMPPEAAAAVLPADSDDESKSDQPAIEPQGSEVKADLESRLKALDSAELDDDKRRKAAEFYQQAIESFDAAQQQVEAAKRFQDQFEMMLSGRYSTQAYAEKLAKPLPPYTDFAGEPLSTVEEWATNVEKSLEGYRVDLKEMTAEPKRRSQRMAEIPTQVAETQQRLKQIVEQLGSLSGDDAGNPVSAARRSALTQSEIACRWTLEALDREQRLYQQGGEWVKVRRDYFTRYVPHKERRLAQLREEINRRREADAQQKVLQAAKEAEVARPLEIDALAQANKALTKRRAQVVAEITELSKQNAAIDEQLETLNAQFERAQKQVQLDELSDYSGQLLREQQAKLPNLRALRRAHARREPMRSAVLLNIYAANDERAELADVDELANQLAARAGDLSDTFRAEIRKLLEVKRDTLEELIENYETYSGYLNDLYANEAQVIATTEEYAAFIAERVLWIRSCDPLQPRDLGPAAAAAAWSLDPRQWRDAGLAVLGAGSRQPIMFTLFALGFTALMFAQRPARRRLFELGDEAEKRSCTKLRPTLNAVWLTAVIALPWPALLAFLGWAMDDYGETEFVRSLSVSTRFTAVCLLMLEIVRHLCRNGGLADAHFDWGEPYLIHLRRKLRWLLVPGLPLVLWLVGLEVQTTLPLASSTLGRACFILVMLLLAVVLHRILIARNSPFRYLVLYSKGGWLKPLQLAWRPVLVLLPASLAVLAAVGYYYTAQQAALRVLQTAAMILAVLTLGGLTRRWLLVNRRSLAREQAKQRRAQLAAAADADAAAPPAADAIDDAVNLAALSEQTQKLVRTFLAITTAIGLILIWAEILPALAYPAARLLPGANELTWGHLGAFLLVLAVTYITVRDVPALLELVILQHLPLDSGARYAFTSMSRYVLTAVGLTIAFNAIGGQWSKIQWLVAAMSVGLGFGLQEIFANFVSGVILLFERPIRVGDVVTIGDRSGVVNRIRMRATTIVDWDRKEYIIPNKDLVTERLLNWTLSDQMNRIEVVVIVANGANTDLACRLLIEAAREQPHVLAEPAPVALFEGFTDNGLKLALRCFLPALEHRSATIHGLHTTVNRKFIAAGVENSYGDLHVRLLDDRTPAPAGYPPHANGKHDAAMNGKH